MEKVMAMDYEQVNHAKKARVWIPQETIAKGSGAIYFGQAWTDSDVEYISIQEANRLEHKACPCLHTEPCQKRCTCVMGHSSHGCAFCCSYGSQEQQRVRAEHLRSLILLGLEVEADRVHNTRQRAEQAARRIVDLDVMGLENPLNYEQTVADIIAAEFEK